MSPVPPGAPPDRGGALPTWRLLDLGRCPPERAQSFAEAVAPSVADGSVPNTLLLARPSAPYISLGYHQSYAEELEPGFLARRPLPVLRRVEGGGTTYLDPDQIFYQLVYRDEATAAGGAADLARVLGAVARAARQLGLEASVRPPCDLVVGDRKFSGNAGGDWEGAHLIVGGWLLRADRETMADLLRLPDPALRPLLLREMGRWITSWEEETGGCPAPEHIAPALVEGFERAGLFRALPGETTEAEEARFRDEVAPRIETPEWRELPPLPKPPGPSVRRVRVAGPHGLWIVDGGSDGGRWAAVVEGNRIQEAFRWPEGDPGALLLVEPGRAEWEELRAATARLPAFE